MSRQLANDEFETFHSEHEPATEWTDPDFQGLGRRPIGARRGPPRRFLRNIQTHPKMMPIPRSTYPDVISGEEYLRNGTSTYTHDLRGELGKKSFFKKAQKQFKKAVSVLLPIPTYVAKIARKTTVARAKAAGYNQAMSDQAAAQAPMIGPPEAGPAGPPGSEAYWPEETQAVPVAPPSAPQPGPDFSWTPSGWIWKGTQGVPAAYNAVYNPAPPQYPQYPQSYAPAPAFQRPMPFYEEMYQEPQDETQLAPSAAEAPPRMYFSPAEAPAQADTDAPPPFEEDFYPPDAAEMTPDGNIEPSPESEMELQEMRGLGTLRTLQASPWADIIPGYNILKAVAKPIMKKAKAQLTKPAAGTTADAGTTLSPIVPGGDYYFPEKKTSTLTYVGIAGAFLAALFILPKLFRGGRR